MFYEGMLCIDSFNLQEEVNAVLDCRVHAIEYQLPRYGTVL